MAATTSAAADAGDRQKARGSRRQATAPRRTRKLGGISHVSSSVLGQLTCTVPLRYPARHAADSPVDDIRRGFPRRSNVMRIAIRWLVRLLASAGLAVDAYVHADLASRYDPIRSSISQGDLFRIEAGIASLAALLVLVLGRRESYALAFVVAASAFGAIVLYRYVNVGTLGPLPNMYEPIWFTEKSVAAVAEGVAVIASLVGFGLTLIKPTPRPRPESGL